jgi:ATP-dependent helicase/nuclease subunit B
VSESFGRANVFTIAPGAPFLASFVAALLDGQIVPGLDRTQGPLALARATIYVPTRRARRALVAALAEAAGHATLLPRIGALGALDDDEPHPDDDSTLADAAIPPAIGDLERRLLLTHLVLGWTRNLESAIARADSPVDADEAEARAVGSTAADAFALAGSLGELIDEFIIGNVDWRALRGLAGDEHDQYWQITTRFLAIAFEQWPNILHERGLVDLAARRVKLADAETARLPSRASDNPVIVLGSTGTNEATARLMAAICRLPNGAVVLPGLDQAMADADFAALSSFDPNAHDPAFGHPQAALKRLLTTLRVARDDVTELAPRGFAARQRFLSEAMRPAATTDQWAAFRKTFGASVASAFDGVALLEAADEREEALAIAIRLREVLETPGASAALVTPDRAVARRVRAELRRWTIDVDDSGGETLAATQAGTLARLVLSAALDRSDASLLSLLAHPLVALRIGRREVERLSSLFEIGVARAGFTAGLLPAARVVAARAATKDRHAHAGAKAIRENDWAAIESLLTDIHAALQPLATLRSQASLADHLAAHRAAVVAFAGAISGEDGAALDLLFEEASAGAGGALALDTVDYRGLFEQLAAMRVLRDPRHAHPRIKILGLLEARLIPADVVVIAGLDETIWPPAARTDPFLNRPMRAALGLMPPERRIGQTAHDFWMAMGAPQVLLTRAKKRDRAPTVPSRFLQRIAALAGDDLAAPRARGAALASLARRLDHGPRAAPLSPPRPRPPLALRPNRLSVTRIETLIRDPYAIHAERILKLVALGGLDEGPGLSDQGTAIHAAISAFAREFPTGPLPPEARNRLVELADAALAAHQGDPSWQTFGRPLILAGLDFYLAYEIERRPDIARLLDEAAGVMTITLDDGSHFTLSGTADRIEILNDGGVRIVDYKTGQAPAPKQIKADLAPQLTLEAVMAQEGAFAALGCADVRDALYLKLGGRKGGFRRLLDFDGESFAEVVARHRDLLHALANAWRDPARPYVSRPIAEFASKYSDYDHLARVKEWSATGGAAGDES